MHSSVKLHQAFKVFAQEQPSAPAIITDDGVLTYAELDAIADALALDILTRGLNIHEAIGVFTARSAQLPLAFLAIQKAGCVYVPMVADHPADRLVNMAQQAGLRRLIVLDGLEPPRALVEALKDNGAKDASDAIITPKLIHANRSRSGDFPDQTCAMTDLAAILFTSGSTGTPKGVMIRHDSCVNMAGGHIEAHGITHKDRILLSTSPGFILGFRELCLPFMSGAAFVPVSRSVIDAPDRLLALMARHRVSIAMFTPSYLRLLGGNVPEGLRCIVTAGERPNVDDARQYAQHLDYWNVHGATEVCGTICMHRVDPAGEGPLPSGRPFANTAVYLLDENGDDVAEGAIGEIHIVGVGVSPGYLKQPQLTAESFVETRYGRAFRTHDLARWNINGELETLGRADDVVKISGQSVALGEIERALLRYPGVRRASAMQISGLLVAYVECPDSAQEQTFDWRKFLGNALPSYMIPAQVAVLAKMPMSSAGKVDRKALLENADAFFNRTRATEEGVVPQGPLEQQIATIWEDVVGVQPIFREDNFFSVGGTSLTSIAVSQRLQVCGYNVSVQMVLASLTVAELAKRIAALGEQATIDATPLINTATTDQQGFWVASEIGLAPAASHIVRVLGVRGSCPAKEVWQAAWARLIDRHPALRTGFYADEISALRWRTFTAPQLSPKTHFSFDHCPSLEKAREIVRYWANQRFPLSEPPLVRAGLIEVDEGEETLFWFVLHHAVVDGMSAQLLLVDLLALLGNQPLPTPPHGIAIASRAEHLYLGSPRVLRDREFWRNRLDALVADDCNAFDEYVSDHPRPTMPSGRGAPPLTEQLDAVTVEALGRLAKMHGAGLHALLLAILAAEVKRRDRFGDVIIGSGISIRPAGAESAIGHFVSVLPVIIEGKSDISFATFLRIVQSSLTETVDHGAYPASLLYREFRQRHPDLRTHSRTSLFDIALTAIPPRTCIDRQTGLILAPRILPGELDYPAAGLDLSFSHEPCPEDGGLNLLLSWNPDVCSQRTASDWLSSFAAWARWLGEEPGRIEQPLPELLPHEIAMLKQWEWGPVQPRPNQRSNELFEALADKQPDHPAVIGKQYIETFSQLDARANGIAHHLIHQGVVRGTMVAVLIEYPADLPATVLGIWKAGGIYLPLAHELPVARLATIIKDAGASVLIVLDGLKVPEDLIGPVRSVVRIEECIVSDKRPCSHGSPDDTAFIVYTSGTTGIPKGVPLTHRGYINAVLGVAETVSIVPEDRMAMVATVGFDASLWELGHGLLGGISLVPVSHELRDDPWLLKRYYQDLGVTVAFHTPSYLRVSEQVPFEGLRLLFTGGEAPNHRDVHFHAGRQAFWNFYGPTEATIVVLSGRILIDHDPETPLAVGRPLPNVRVSLRRSDGTPVPPGQQGELWLGGTGITSGYLNRPDLNAERFTTTSEGRFYRSGDYGRWTADGQIEICGRIDQQIKLNGQRVELGEIEETLRKHPTVTAAVVLIDVAANGAKVLRAFIRTKDISPQTETLTGFLSERLPAHMLPATITSVDTLPLTTVGKIDQQKLLSDYAKQQAARVVSDTPASLLEMHVAALWADILGVPVTRNDNFFALGGNSLSAVTLAHRVSENLGSKISARTLFKAPTLEEFVSVIKSQTTAAEQADLTPMSDLVTEGEREFWTAEKAGLDTRTFTIPIQYRIKGDVTFGRWQNAWSMLVDRHEGLRTTFREDEAGQLQRCVAPVVAVTMETAVMADEGAALAHIRQRQANPLSMNVAPLWRIGLVEAQKESVHFIWLALHHAIGDGQSIGTLFQELTLLLAEEELLPPGDHARVFSSREQRYFASTDSKEDAEYWDNLLQQVPIAAFDEWPVDQPRSATTRTGNHRFAITFNPQTFSALKSLARSYDSSFHSLMLTLLSLEVRRRTGRTDVVIGTTASIRESIADTKIVGYGVNMLPLHLKPAASESFGDLLRATQHSLALTLQHARYPFARIYRSFWSNRPELRHPQRYPLFDIAVTENPGAENITIPERFSRAITASGSIGYERTEASPGQDIILIHEGLANGEFLMLLQLNAAVYSEETARNWFESLVGLARWLAENPSRAAQALPLLLPEERLLLSSWEYGEKRERPYLRFHELFEMVVDRPGQGDRAAVITRENSISYRALEEEANAVAHALVERGIGPGTIVAVLAGRSAHLPVAALAVWKAGATYLPLAFDLPPERLAFIARDAGVSQLIALDGVNVPAPLAHELPDPLRPEELSEAFLIEHIGRTGISGKPSDVAYILYTSGSTGEPKGTLVGHDSYVNLVLGTIEAYGLTADDRCLMFASPSFDVSLSDIGVPLACGAATCPVSNATIESPKNFLKFLFDLGITVADITPTYLRLFDACQLPASLRILVTGGEPPFPVDAAAYATQLSYFNAYGPTENTITSTLGILMGDEAGRLTAGRPLPNTSVHICDYLGQPLPPAVVGEIWLGGCGLSQGYLNRPELTTAHFQDTPWGRRFRSGDLGRWSPTGKLEIHGRIDDQVKLSGIRIELGEIEHALTGHAAISQAVALLVEQDNGAKGLWAVVRPQPGEDTPSEDEWRNYLSDRLPSYMIPSGVVPLATFPLSTSGKVDRSALFALLAEHSTSSSLTLPKDDLERTVAEAWEAVLSKSPIHREDNFFVLGGHSLLAILVAYRLEKSLGREVPARELFVEPTLAGFAARLRSANPLQPIIDVASDLATEGQREFWTAEKAGLDTCGFNISLTLAVQGELPPDKQWRAAWNELLSRHEALRTGFKEDDASVLRRIIVARPQATFNIQKVSTLCEAQDGIKDQQLQPFSMTTPGLWRAGLMHINEGRGTLFWFVMHHSVGDGLSLSILADELTALLKGAPLPLLTFCFSHSAAREITYLGSETAIADAAYWQKLIGGIAERSPDTFDEWRLDKMRPNVRTATTSKGGHCFRCRLAPTIAEGLRSLARRNGASLHAFMLAFLGLEVRRRTGRSEFMLGTAASTRQSAAEAQTFGYFVNMLPLFFHIDEAPSIDAAVQTMQRELAETLQHSRYPFARIYGDFRKKYPQATHPMRYPLFDIAVTENPAINLDAEGVLHLAGLATAKSDAVSYHLQRNSPAQDLVLIHEGQPDGGLMLTWFANAAIYTKDTAHTWFDSLLAWAHFFANNPPGNNELLPPLLPAEKHLLQQWQKGSPRSLPYTSFPDLFRWLAETHPERPAVVTDTAVHSYGLINAFADHLAHILLDFDLKRGEAVAVLTERSAALPEAVLAVWKAGGCYLPLTADLPAERLAFMAKDADVRIVIVLDGLDLSPEFTTEHYVVIRPEKLPQDIKRPTPLPQLSSDDLAYIIYTSGSTGVPKGVVLRHGGMLNLGLSTAGIFGVKPDDRALLMSSPSFDLWISDLVTAWSVGGALVPVRREAMNDIAAMHAMLKRLAVTIATMSPSYLSLFERADLAGIRVLMTVGEPPRQEDVQYYAKKVTYFNGYGPTENTAATTIGHLRVDQEQLVAGRPLANMEISIHDDCGNLVPPGGVGEIWLGGMGLAAGYLNRPDLTAARFVETKAGRRYCTGDLGRWLRSGDLQVLGRTDDQIKLRGQRVELGEIEHRLAAYPGVQQAVAAVERLADHNLRLLAFVILKPQTLAPSPAQWSVYLGKNLPSYMVPSAVFQVSAIPLTDAGKIDRRILLSGALTLDQDNTVIGSADIAGHHVRTPPQTAIEILISEIWQELLDHALVMREDDFFELGGDSLKAIAVISRLNRGYQCQVNDLYEHPRLADFADYCCPRLDNTLDSDATIFVENTIESEPHQKRNGSKVEEELLRQRGLYETKIRTALLCDCTIRKTYQHVVLTGATGYLGSYLLQELLSTPSTEVTALVRGTDNVSAHARLSEVLDYYFGAAIGRTLWDNPRLHVLASDLRHADLLLPGQSYSHLAATVDSIYHCAANVNHIGHYRDFYADNVVATENLLSLAKQHTPSSVDFHFVSTLSVAGSASPTETRLFTEYDLVPKVPNSNYYVRTKQESEQRVIAARGELGNTCIYRVGNIGFATNSSILQKNIDKNAFFRQLVAFLRLGAVPAELFASISYVDTVARAIVALANTKGLANEIHHIETSQRDRLVDFIRFPDVIAVEKIRACNVTDFSKRLREAIEEPELEAVAAETMEAFGLHVDRPFPTQSHRLTITSERTQLMLEKLGITWPAIPPVGQNALLHAALERCQPQND